MTSGIELNKTFHLLHLQIQNITQIFNLFIIILGSPSETSNSKSTDFDSKRPSVDLRI